MVKMIECSVYNRMVPHYKIHERQECEHVLCDDCAYYYHDQIDE